MLHRPRKSKRNNWPPRLERCCQGPITRNRKCFEGDGFWWKDPNASKAKHNLMNLHKSDGNLNSNGRITGDTFGDFRLLLISLTAHAKSLNKEFTNQYPNTTVHICNQHVSNSPIKMKSSITSKWTSNLRTANRSAETDEMMSGKTLREN